MKRLFIFIGIVVGLTSCTDDDENTQVIQLNCDALAEVLPNDEFDALPNADFSITDVSLDEDCLVVNISASGCDPDNWDMNLYSTDAFFTGLPTVRAVKVEVINNEACLAVFEKTKSFDLTPFQLQNLNEIVLAIEGWPEQMSYEY
jgi:hypothetical protein